MSLHEVEIEDDDEFIKFVKGVFHNEELPPEVIRLRERQRQLRAELGKVDDELVTSRKDRVLLRKLPTYFWLPTYGTYALLNRLPAVQRSDGDPMLLHWRFYAGWVSLGINVMLWVFYLAVLLALLQLLL